MRTNETMIKDYDGHKASKATNIQLRDIQKTLPLRVLSDDDWSNWQTYGYVIVREAISEAAAAELVKVLWEFNEADPALPDTWNKPDRRKHRSAEFNDVGMLEIYHHQLMWNNRQNPRIYNVFVDIWDREDLWVLPDRANLSTPKPGKVENVGFFHWDVDTSSEPLPISVQGTLSLTHQSSQTGGFQCVPGIFKDLESWIESQPNNRHPLHPDVTGYEVVTPELNPGDLIVWNSLLPHAIKPNQSRDLFRAAQYISMTPADYGNEKERLDRITRHKNLDKPSAGCFPGDPRDWEKRHYGPAKLTELGEKLLGIQSWF
jgi:ectoine hydroxylase-related dioxygenase (phytanoyl-CoA dioxygenase family)